MIPVQFDYVRADSADAALAALAEHGDEAKLMAGGHSLLPMMKLRLAYPSVVVDIGRLSDLSYINDAGDHLAIGALTRHRDVEISDLVAEHAPLLAAATANVGDPQVRHRGTIGGSLAHADAAADHPSALLALGGSVVARSAGGEERVIDGADLFAGFLESSLDPTEMITEVRIPKHTGSGWNFQKFNRRAQDWASSACRPSRSTGRPRSPWSTCTRRRFGPPRWNRPWLVGPRRPRRPSRRPKAWSRRVTSTPASSTASTWPGC